MTPVSTSGATQGVSAQFQAAVLKTAQDVQKQEGEAAVSLIQSAVEATERSIPSGTGKQYRCHRVAHYRGQGTGEGLIEPPIFPARQQ